MASLLQSAPVPSAVPAAARASRAGAAREPAAGARGARWRGYAWAVAAVAAATVAGWPLYHGLRAPDPARPPLLANTNVLMLYLLAVLWVATRHTLGAAVLASALGVVAFDVCFVPPYLSLAVAERQDLVTFAVMLVTAAVISTLTHRVRAHSERARREWERAEAEALRNTLLSAVSHDLRTPLSAITGAADALSEGGDALPAGARRELIETVAAEADRMERLINNLLDMTRLESGGLVLRREWQPLDEAVGAALRQLDRRLRGREVSVQVPADLPLVRVDGAALEQVVVNLLDNAVEHTPPGTPVAVIAGASAGAVWLEVADRGPGLPPGAEGRVFEKFFSAAPGAGRAGTRRGIGLGLAIARGIIEAHGGSVLARDRPGGGAVFRISLPARETPPTVDASA